MMSNRSELNSYYNNPAFQNDDSQPPSYSSIYPFSLSYSMSSANSDSKATSNCVSSEFETNQIQTEDNVNNINNNHQSSCNSNISSANLFQNSSEPISYEQLFMNSFTSTPSTRFLFRGRDFTHNQISNNPTSMESRIRKQLKSHFNKSYILRHTTFITVSSLTLVSFQVILINNKSVLSHLGTGIWAGFVNLFVLLLSLLTLKYAKLWLLLVTIIAHFICITINLGSLIVINCIAATKYTSCSYRPFYDSSLNNTDQINCNESNMKYGNIAMIMLGAVCMLTFVTFFFKLISVFNNSQSSNE